MTWCKDIARDAAVRAAEDGRTEPLPTLGEAIAAPFASGNSTAQPYGSQAASGGGVDPVVREARLRDESRTAEYLVSLDEASGGGEREPADAWGVVVNGSVEGVAHRRFRRYAERVGEELHGTVVPLYRQPPQPRGWLTPTQRLLLENAASTCRAEASSCYRNGDQHEAHVYALEAENIDEILARSTPPEVVLPEMVIAYDDMDMLKEALAAAGVAVKEVGK